MYEHAVVAVLNLYSENENFSFYMQYSFHETAQHGVLMGGDNFMLKA